MRLAVPGSVLVHVAVLGIALIGFSWPESDDAPAAEAVSIIATSSVSANASAVIQSDSTENLVSSGTVASPPPTLEPITPETVTAIAEAVTPLWPQPQQPVIDQAMTPAKVEAVEPLPAEVTDAEPPVHVPVEPGIDVAILSSTAISTLSSQPLTATTAPVLEPFTTADLKSAPIPRTLSFERTSQPTDPKPAPSQQQPQPEAVQPLPSQSGNGGANNADAVAAAGSPAQQAGAGNGGDAEVARYPGEVLRKLRRALRSGHGPSGEVVVRFTVLASGQITGISIGRSSGNAAVDQAGLATVSRAAPFPPIPPQSNRSTWTFDVPLAFGG